MSYKNQNRFRPGALGLMVLVGLFSLCACQAESESKRPKSSDPTLVLVSELADSNGFKEIEFTEKTIAFKSPWTSLLIYKYSRKAMFNGTTIWLSAASSVHEGKWAISKADYQKTVLPLLRPLDHLAEFGYKTIVIDPGHGGEDGGGSGPGELLEKNIALKISKAVRDGLVKLGYTVHLTRDTDIFIPLEERCRMAMEWKADMFISIHCNAGASKHAEGIETYSLSLPNYPSTNDAGKRSSNADANPGNKHDNANMALGHSVQKSIVASSGRADRGLRRARFVVLRDAPCPATLVECGFLSNQTEAQLLQNASYMTRLCNALVVGVDDYIAKVRKARLVASDIN